MRLVALWVGVDRRDAHRALEGAILILILLNPYVGLGASDGLGKRTDRSS
jgi:hypothetical protein